MAARKYRQLPKSGWPLARLSAGGGGSGGRCCTWRSPATAWPGGTAVRERAARLEHLEAALELVYDEWIGLEAARAQADLQRWRRTLRP